MKRMLLAAACIAVLANVGVSIAASPGVQPAPPPPLPKTALADTATSQVLLTFHLIRVYGDISGETSLTDNLWSGIKDEKLEAQKGPFTFFTLAKLTVAGVKLRADESGWTWDGEEKPSKGKKVELIASPRVMVALPNSFKIAISSEQAIEYFEKRPDGLFELKMAREETGLSVSGIPEMGESGRIVLRDLTIGLRSVEKRQPIEGVSLDVGRPIVETREHKTVIAVKPNRDYGIEFITEGYGFLIMRLRVDLVKSE